MSALIDQAARTTALTDLSRSFLVEAGAGSGKTSLMAGRIVSILASGVAPRLIAAVSFTEMAASELHARITKFIDRALSGAIPPDLAVAFPAGLSPSQRAHLSDAKPHLGELTCTTIHGFAQRLVKPYPVEADIDPGARIIDPAGADLLFQDVFDVWLRERLSGTDASKDLLTSLVSHDPYAAVSLIREIAGLMRSYRDAAPLDASIRDLSCDEFREASSAFADFLRGLHFNQEDTKAISDAFRVIAQGWDKVDALPDHLRIMAIASIELPDVLVKKTDGEFRAYRMKGKWQKASAKGMGDSLNDQATSHYERCCAALGALRMHASACGLSLLVKEIRPLVDLYQTRKRKAALLDFDDLLIAARDMLRRHADVRAALGERFPCILVDEFQDTDPVQTEIFRLLAFDPPASERAGTDLTSWVPRPGAIFLVGDPKQAIYRFRGADVRAYLETRDALQRIDPGSILEVGTNFRSCEGVLSFVNERFSTPLTAPGQPGFARLNHHRLDHGQGACVATLDVEEGESASHSRDIEAKAVAELCARLLDSYNVVDAHSRELRPCEPGDIALLAPTGTELWRYEAALETMGLAVATQAGKGLFQRQEVQDLIALTRILADGRDWLALGAFLRGPLVGLTEEELLDISSSLPPPEEGGLTFLRVGTDPDFIRHPIAREVIRTLASLRRRGKRTTPYDILSQAVEELRVRPILSARHSGNAERALANVDRYLEMSRPYSVRGLRAFSDDMRRAWEDGERLGEGRPDAEEQSISLITMHSAKGLEWPVVIPVNTLTETLRGSRLVFDVATRRMTMPFLDVKPSNYADALVASAQEHSSERVRLWYVATTRARDLLILPRYAKAGQKAWTNVVEFGLGDIAAIDQPGPCPMPAEAERKGINVQDEVSFEEERVRIADRRRPVIWHSPSRHEPSIAASERLSLDEIISATPEMDPLRMITGSKERGIILHKLMEEVLIGETAETRRDLETRAAQLTTQLLGDRDPAEVDANPVEIARTVERTLALPEIATMRERIVPEVVVLNSVKGDAVENVVFGVADAVAMEVDAPEEIDVVIDWKSDMRPDKATIERYRDQVRSYVDTVGAKRGLIVFMSTGQVVEVKTMLRRTA